MTVTNSVSSLVPELLKIKVPLGFPVVDASFEVVVFASCLKSTHLDFHPQFEIPERCGVEGD